MTDIPRYTAHPGYVTPARQGELCFYKDLEALRKRVEELEEYIRQHVGVTWPAGYRRITDDQIDAAWRFVQVNLEIGSREWHVAMGVFKRINIVRCEGCKGTGWTPTDVCADDKCQCPNCNGHGWVVKDEKLK